jgi:predicted nucleic acid-binding protein
MLLSKKLKMYYFDANILKNAVDNTFYYHRMKKILDTSDMESIDLIFEIWVYNQRLLLTAFFDKKEHILYFDFKTIKEVEPKIESEIEKDFEKLLESIGKTYIINEKEKVKVFKF